MRRFVVGVPFLLCSCAWQSPALQLGPNTYQTTANASPARGAVSGAREMALTNANKKCSSMGKQINVTNIETGYAFSTNGTATVTFECN